MRIARLGQGKQPPTMPIEQVTLASSSYGLGWLGPFPVLSPPPFGMLPFLPPPHLPTMSFCTSLCQTSRPRFFVRCYPSCSNWCGSLFDPIGVAILCSLFAIRDAPIHLAFLSFSYFLLATGICSVLVSSSIVTIVAIRPCLSLIDLQHECSYPWSLPSPIASTDAPLRYLCPSVLLVCPHKFRYLRCLCLFLKCHL